jgi:DNA-binding NarL/FixJ family response regulator
VLFVLKGSTSSDLLEAIQAAHAGSTFITPGFATTVIMSMKADALRRNKETQRQLSIRESKLSVT